jgi:antitoxin ParD1/3/4
MPNVEKMNIALTPDLAFLVQQAVEHDGYVSVSEVIDEALRDWSAKQSHREQQIEKLRTLWQEGIASGPGRFSDISEILLFISTGFPCVPKS